MPFHTRRLGSRRGVCGRRADRGGALPRSCLARSCAVGGWATADSSSSKRCCRFGRRAPVALATFVADARAPAGLSRGGGREGIPPWITLPADRATRAPSDTSSPQGGNHHPPWRRAAIRRARRDRRHCFRPPHRGAVRCARPPRGCVWKTPRGCVWMIAAPSRAAAVVCDGPAGGNRPGGGSCSGGGSSHDGSTCPRQAPLSPHAAGPWPSCGARGRGAHGRRWGRRTPAARVHAARTPAERR